MITLSRREAALAPIALLVLVVIVALAFWIYTSRGKASAPGTEPADQGEPAISHYIEIVDGCGPHSDEKPCVNLRPSPGTSSPEIEKLRVGLVLKVEADPVPDENPAQRDREWHKVIFDGEIRYPERVAGDWYVVADPKSVRPFEDVGDQDAAPGATTTGDKRIVVDLSDAKLYAYDGDALFMAEPISAGLEDTPTPRGEFSIFRKTPSRYMQGPLPGVSEQYYDLPGVPWNLYFTTGGAVIHGAYWHDNFGERWSHGCVNLTPQNAAQLYRWAELGVPVSVRD